VLIDRLGHLKHIQLLAAEDRLQLVIGQDFPFVFWILKIVLLDVRPNHVTSLRGSGSVPTILARCSEGCIGFIKALFFALGVVFAIVLSVHCIARVASFAITGIVTDPVDRWRVTRRTPAR
jgi:hypothetical protein